MEHQEFIKRIKKTLYYGATSPVQCDRISRPLADYTAEMFSETHKGTSLNRLDFATVSKLKITPCSLILAMVYLDRLNDLDPVYARKITPSELFLVSMMVSTKFYCGYDEDVYLSAWAEYGSITLDHLKELELDFLDAMNWEIYVSDYEFFEKLKSIECVLAKRQGLKRGWLTYTELTQLLPTLSIAKQIINYSTILTLSYLAGVMTIFGGFFVASQVPGTSLSLTNKTSPSTLGGRTTIDRSISRSNKSAHVLNKNGQSNDNNELTIDDETELDYMMEDLNESIENYDDESKTELKACNFKNTSMSSMFDNLNLLLKCNYGTDVGINNGVLLKNYLDDDGKIRKNRTHWQWISEILGQKYYNEESTFDPTRLFPTIWLKFM